MPLARVYGAACGMLTLVVRQSWPSRPASIHQPLLPTSASADCASAASLALSESLAMRVRVGRSARPPLLTMSVRSA